MEEHKLDLNMVFSEEFLKMSFPKKRSILKEFLLQEGIIEKIQENIQGVKDWTQVQQIRKDTMQKFVGMDALCFEDHQQDDEGSGRRWFLSGNDTSQKLKSITANKFYKILDVKDSETTGDILIKINSDTGRKSWVMTNRFLFGEPVLRKLRAEKLKQLF